MAKSKKKKASPQYQKQLEAENRKRFHQKIREFFKLLGHEELFWLVPRDYLKIVVKERIGPPSIKVTGKIPCDFKNEKELVREINLVFKSLTIEIPENNTSISYYDFFTIGTCFYMVFLMDGYDRFPDNNLVKDKLDGLKKLFSKEKLQEILQLLFNVVSMNFSCFSTIYYKIELDDFKDNPDHFQYKFLFKEVYRAKHVEIKTGDNFRPVLPVGYYIDDKFFPMSLSPDKLNLPESCYPEKIPVYIQNHAIIRIKERIDGTPPGFLWIMINDAILEPEIHRTGYYSFLLSYRIHNYKVGYLAADLVDNKLVIRTFLLSTQSGTPEEQRFKQITGLERDDIEFLNLTKLSSFARSGIEDNPRLKEIFNEAGLTPLIECANIHYREDIKRLSISATLAKYLNIEPGPSFRDNTSVLFERELAEEKTGIFIAP